MPLYDPPIACRLLIDPASGGAWQMAVDEALLETAAAGGARTLRFYHWSEPTLSLGYFQAYADRADAPRQPRLPAGAAANRRRRDPARPRADLQPGGAG